MGQNARAPVVRWPPPLRGADQFSTIYRKVPVAVAEAAGGVPNIQCFCAQPGPEYPGEQAVAVFDGEALRRIKAERQVGHAPALRNGATSGRAHMNGPASRAR